jgi:hypothetical protein
MEDEKAAISISSSLFLPQPARDNVPSAAIKNIFEFLCNIIFHPFIVLNV